MPRSTPVTRRPAEALLIRNCSGVGQTSGLPVHGASGSVNPVWSEDRARGPAKRQTGGLMPVGFHARPGGTHENRPTLQRWV